MFGSTKYQDKVCPIPKRPRWCREERWENFKRALGKGKVLPGTPYILREWFSCIRRLRKTINDQDSSLSIQRKLNVPALRVFDPSLELRKALMTNPHYVGSRLREIGYVDIFLGQRKPYIFRTWYHHAEAGSIGVGLDWLTKNLPSDLLAEIALTRSEVYATKWDGHKVDLNYIAQTISRRLKETAVTKLEEDNKRLKEEAVVKLVEQERQRQSRHQQDQQRRQQWSKVIGPVARQIFLAAGLKDPGSNRFEVIRRAVTLASTQAAPHRVLDALIKSLRTRNDLPLAMGYVVVARRSLDSPPIPIDIDTIRNLGHNELANLRKSKYAAIEIDDRSIVEEPTAIDEDAAKRFALLEFDGPTIYYQRI